MNIKLRQFATSGFAILGTAIGFTFLNGATPIEILSLQQFGYSHQAWAQDADEATSERVYANARPAVVSIESDDGTGSGSIISADGLILTNAHVIGNSRTVKVRLEDGRTLEGRVVGYGDGLDLAAVRVQGNNFPVIPLASATARVGQKAFAIGSPFGLEGTFTTGIVSRLDNERGVIQTDAAINPGNSGGPLLNSQGQLIGVNTSIYAISRDSGNIGIGFAINTNRIQPFLTAVRNGNASQTPGRGLVAQSITLNGAPVQGRLDSNSSVLEDDNSYYARYTFEGKAGQRIVISMTSSELDAYLILLSPNGDDLGQDDNGAGGKNAKLTVTLPENGTYTVLANTSSAREMGRYSLQAAVNGGSSTVNGGGSGSTPRPNASQQASGSLPLQIQGSLGANSRVLQSDRSPYQEHTFQGNAGQRVSISLESREFDSYLILLDPDGKKIAENDDASANTMNSALTVTLPSTGTYRIIANTYDSTGRGQYTLSIR
ncbi:MAG: trypsin-like peptidase domain-containing protein [Timaviella obliquedivisa GSE-PSE-MK23-08B]|jgi:serine protease Do|nr:trypsin-like peptidase domain-containing protein [Timaviella obliquedivisa GSE-PSE-MK23-08B]